MRHRFLNSAHRRVGALAVLLSVATLLVPATASAATASAGTLEPVPADWSKVPCAPGTTSLPVVEGFDNGTPTRIHLCGLPDLKALANDEEASVRTSKYHVEGADGHAMVNARISRNALRLVEAARADGVTLTATSSFRRDDHQRDLYDCYVAGKAGCSPAAEPGYSSHQMGLAIDFVMPSSSAGCTGGAAANDPSWKWLHEHAGEFAFRQLSGESWHWDTSTAGQELC